jgi:hypothetical protein
MTEYTQDQYDETLMIIINSLSIATIISFPGVMQILSEELNNEVLKILEND